jgi:hypothetical protein
MDNVQYKETSKYGGWLLFGGGGGEGTGYHDHSRILTRGLIRWSTQLQPLIMEYNGRMQQLKIE